MALPVPPPPPAIGSAAPPPPVAAVHTPPPPPPPMAQPTAVPPPPMTAQAPVAPPAPAPMAPPPPVAQAAPAPAPTAPWEDSGAVTVAAVPEAPVAPLAPVPAAPPAPMPTQELMPAASSKEMTAVVPGGGAMVDALAALGFTGLDFGFGSLPIVSLDQGTFKMNDGTELGEEFYCQIQQSRPKYLFKTALDQKDPRHALCYSYDGLTDTKGASVKDQVDAWARMGVAHEMKTYTEAFVILTNQDVVLLSVPPTSIKRFSATIAKIYGRGLPLTETWVKVSKGPKVTNVAVPFIPWAFEIYTG